MEKARSISKTVSDDMLALQRKRIAANRPQMGKLLADIMNKPVYKTLFQASLEGLVNFVDSYKSLSIAIHDIEKHQAPFSICMDKLCQVNNIQINEGIKLIAKLSELEPKVESHE